MSVSRTRVSLETRLPLRLESHTAFHVYDAEWFMLDFTALIC